MSEGPNGSRDEPLAVEIVRDEPRVPLWLLIRVMVIGVALATILPIGFTILIDQLRQEDQIKALRELSYNECLRSESRDTQIVKQNAAIVSLLLTEPNPTQPLLQAIEDLQDGIATLEPQDEPECEVP